MRSLRSPLAALAALFLAGAAPPAPPTPMLVGHWHGEMSGGPISAVADYRFAADGTYAMVGYPSIAERGRYAVATAPTGELTLTLTHRTKCGPCEAAGPVEPAPDSTETATLTAGGALSWRGWTFVRDPTP